MEGERQWEEGELGNGKGAVVKQWLWRPSDWIPFLSLPKKVI